MNKIITFLGTTARETAYCFPDGRVLSGRVFGEALHHFMPDYDEMLVFVTKKAREQAWPVLAQLQDPRIRPIPISAGEHSRAMWELFDRVLAHVHQGDQVTFDITHGLRSIPFLVFLFAAFLKSARQVHLEAIYYGALELGDPHQGKPAPVIELSEFVTLLDWLAATNQFIYNGNARELAALLQAQPDPALQPLAATVRRIALGLELLRPRDVVQASCELPALLTAVADRYPPPFGVLAHALEAAYGHFLPPGEETPQQHLRSHLRLIDWYFDKAHYVHALALAREWVVSLLCVHFELDLWNEDHRMAMEGLLNGVQKESMAPYLEAWQAHPQRKQVQRFWSGAPFMLANLRNDVMHSGFRKSPKTAEAIIEQTRQMIAELHQIAAAWGVEP